MGALRRIRRQRGKSGRRQAKSTGPSGPERIELEMSELEAILGRVKSSLSPAEYDKLHAALETLLFVTQELEKNRVSVQRLKQLLFGATTEKTRKVFQKALEQAPAAPEAEQEQTPKQPEPPPQKARGHGRNGADAYSGAEKVQVAHRSLQGGDACPSCKKGKVYETAEPGRLVRIRGQAPLGATVYELQKLRCNLCGEIFTAKPPKDVGDDKYDAESASMIALLKYGSGLPFNRLERLQGSLGIPLPAATQWDVLTDSLPVFIPIHEALIRAAAQGRVLHNDDTGMKVLSLRALNEPAEQSGEQPTTSARTGVFTSGIVSVLGDHRIALFFTGHNHAGARCAMLYLAICPKNSRSSSPIACRMDAGVSSRWR